VHLAAAAEETCLDDPAAERREQARRTLRRMLAPCTAVVATTAVGFAAICTSSISPVRLLGALIVFGLAWSLVTALCGSVAVAGRTPSPTARTHLPRWLRRVGAWSDRRRWWVFGLFAVASGLCAAGIGRLSFESAFLENFRAHSSVRESYEFIGEHFAPVGSLEVVVQTADGNAVLSPETVRTADAFAAEVVERFDPVRKSQTVGDLLTLFGTGLPRSAWDLRLRLTLLDAAAGAEDPLRAFVNADGSAMRVQFRASESDVSVPEKLGMAAEVRAMAEEAFGPGYRVEVTGLYYFYARLIDGMVRDQYRSVAITVPAVLVVLTLLLRSLRVALVAMIPNLLPMVFCLGVMGWSGIPVNMTTAMMLSVTFGIAVDDTLHYLWRFRDALRETGDYSVAVMRAHGSVGRACVFTTVVIAGGFWILILSEFLPTAYFGGLVGFTMMATLAADLVLLPALLTAIRPFPERGRPGPPAGGAGPLPFDREE
jgi:predicted RND superfamily exporter protein